MIIIAYHTVINFSSVYNICLSISIMYGVVCVPERNKKSVSSIDDATKKLARPTRGGGGWGIIIFTGLREQY